MTDTVNLGLPCIEGSQAQKHVTHNDALRILDTLVQLAVLDRDLTAPPASPAEGQRWIVKTGATGVWAGHADAIAAWQDGAWQFSAPQAGWLAFVVDEGTLVAWNGTAWGDFFATVTSIQNLACLGVGTTADATNPLSAKLNNALFTARTVAESGDGNLRYKLSKESAAKTLSFLFQDNYSGRAEIGLTGDDNFHLKVSPDGATWLEALAINSTTGKVSFPVSGGPREQLAANRTYYVRTDGADTNNGLANTSAGAFLTLQKAVDTVATLDLSIYNVTIQVADGTYGAGVSVAGPWVGRGTVTILGNTTTPANVLISTPGVAVKTDNYARLFIAGVKVQTSTSGAGVEATNGSVLTISGKVEFGSTVGAQVFAHDHAVIVFATTGYTIASGAPIHWQTQGQGTIKAQSMTITLSGAPAFSIAFAYGETLSYQIFNANTFSGAATGTRYSFTGNAVGNSVGSGVNYLPGSASGVTSGGGQYL